jgi:hypothetical protein
LGGNERDQLQGGPVKGAQFSDREEFVGAMDDDVFQWLRGVASGSLAGPMLITTNGIARRHERAEHAERHPRTSSARSGA